MKVCILNETPKAVNPKYIKCVKNTKIKFKTSIKTNPKIIQSIRKQAITYSHCCAFVIFLSLVQLAK